MSLDLDGVIPQRRGHIFYAGDVLPGRRNVFISPFVTHLQQGPGVLFAGAKDVGQSSPTVVETQRVVGSVLSDHFQSVLPLIMEQTDTIVAVDRSVDLCLYAHTDNGREIGLVVRYMRDVYTSFTRTDVLLFPPSVLH